MGLYFRGRHRLPITSQSLYSRFSTCSTVTQEMISDFMSAFYQAFDPNHTYKPARKILLIQYKKEHYIVYFAALKFHLSIVLTLDKVHRVIKYKQKSWLKEYINFNSPQRTQSNDDSSDGKKHTKHVRPSFHDHGNAQLISSDLHQLIT